MTVEKMYCNMCGKIFTDEDDTGGGSIHDNITESDDFDLCADCYEKILALLTKNCKIQPFQDTYEIDEDNGDFDFEEH